MENSHSDHLDAAPWQVMPAQVNGRPKGPCSEPVRRLMLAVLDDAMRVVLSPLGAVRRAERRRAHEWFESGDRSYAFAFERVCEALAFDPAQLRTKLALAAAERDGASRAA